MSAVVVEGLGKAYKKYASRRQRLLEWLLPWGRLRHDVNWVLKDVNFAVAPGEVMGIVGMNGAGKSTLLKLLTGTSAATAGRIQCRGRISALLELGLGFHPDFTGRQNAVATGQLLGYSKNDLRDAMPAIEQFAEIGDYFDQNLRVYSSGMQARLAFSIATAIRPDILIVDEALSVGDAYFQHKSFERIRQIKQTGTTILMVSHDKNSILSICDRAILLNKGRVIAAGRPADVMDHYNALLAEREDNRIRILQTLGDRMQTISGSGEVTVKEIQLYNIKNELIDIVEVGQIVKLKIQLEVHQPVDRLILGYLIKDRLGQSVFGTNTHHLDRALNDLKANEIVTYEFAFCVVLGPGSYSISTAPVSTSDHLESNYEWRDLALTFSVVNSEACYFEGICWMPPSLEVSRSCQ